MRKLGSYHKAKNKENQNRIWKQAFGNKSIETFEEQEVFSLNQEEAKKCRFTKPNKFRNIECVVHRDNFSHGVKLHPPHLWDVRKGKVYYRDSKDSEWKRWYPSTEENLERLTGN